MNANFHEIMVTKTIKEQMEGSFCDFIKPTKYEYDYTDDEGVWTNEIFGSQSLPVIFITRGDNEALNIVLPQHWEKGDSL